MAHSYVEAFPDERSAFRAFAEDVPARTTFLVDTYDTLQGVANAIRVIRELGLAGSSETPLGVRLDSGDLGALAVGARALLDDAGLERVRIFASGGLDELEVARLVAAGAPIDAYGIGTQMGVSADAPSLDSIYKLVEVGGRSVMKLSTGKRTLPGAKQVFRGEGDVLGLRGEEPPPGSTPLLTRVLRAGRRERPAPSLIELRERCAAEVSRLPAETRTLEAPVAPVVSISSRLRELTERTEAAHRRSLGG
jgi:nicotinate phosphoribosyltransferase